MARAHIVTRQMYGGGAYEDSSNVERPKVLSEDMRNVERDVHRMYGITDIFGKIAEKKGINRGARLMKRLGG